ncbi:uncharacterized protein LOC117168920 [Belonocnema kinseyi]|uniref:uncharacterized protein LOC117168920 n=1 Tax=Belonocnema kinseyi TaxID=2817044 RepID=UPI00143D1F44|nr:uncharacterized protein LOC117168920 [Belonocnema kinseyi]
MRRSIEYRIKDEGQKTRALFTAALIIGNVSAIMDAEILIEMPKKGFEHSGIRKMCDKFTAIIPEVITKDIQLLYSAFGREVKGTKKNNFSQTHTYKLLRGAKDREGGRKKFSQILKSYKIWRTIEILLKKS